MLKKVLLSITLASYLFVSTMAAGILSRTQNSPLVPTAQAQEEVWFDSGFLNWYTKVYDDSNEDEIFGERYTAAQVQWIFYSIFSFFLNWIGNRNINHCLISAIGGNADFSSCQTAMNDFFSSIYCNLFPLSPSCILPNGDNSINQNGGTRLVQKYSDIGRRPISFVTYVRDIGEKLRIVPEAKAQGFGFTAAQPILELWRQVRNITYFLLILIIIIMAFMIMFRVKISPQTVITVQSALPKIIITLLLITFSYAIAGFAIDLMYVVIGLVSAILTSGTNAISGFDWNQMYGALTNQRSTISLMWYYSFAFAPAIFLALGQSGWLGLLASGTFIIPVVFIILVGIVVLFLTVKIFWLMIKTYVTILMLIIFGPIQILSGALGGSGFGGWFKNLLANLAVYPAVGFMFVLAFVFLRGGIGVAWIPDQFFPFDVSDIFAAQTGGGAEVWQPPLTVGGGDPELLWLGASLVIITLIPKIADIIKSAIQGRPFGYGSALGETAMSGLAGGRMLGGYGTAKLAERQGNLTIPSRIPVVGGKSLLTSERRKKLKSLHEFGARAKWWTGRT